MTYWDTYSNLQAVKHSLIKEYLKGWLPKLGFWKGRIVYFDTHAGRGRHGTGHAGSPIVALQTLLAHTYRDRLLKNCEFVYYFIENDPAAHAALKSEIGALDIPPGIRVIAELEDGYAVMGDVVKRYQTSAAKQIAPSFIFVDPFGFSLPGGLLRDLMQFERVELFINVIWREMDMAITQARERLAEGNDQHGMVKRLDTIFGGRGWVDSIDSNDIDERAVQTCQLFQELTHATWATYISMRGGNNRTRYVLLHLTNHNAGRDLMKDCMWKVCPDGSGGFYARKNVNASQLTLIPSAGFDLDEVMDWVKATLMGAPQRWQDLLELARSELWRGPHVNKAVRQLRKAGEIVATNYTGKFSIKANPLLELP